MRKRILLVEPPAVSVALDAENYGETVLSHQKYPQLLLLQNLISRGVPIGNTGFLDLKATDKPRVLTVARFPYGPLEASVSLVGVLDSELQDRLKDFRPAVVGITANFTSERDAVCWVIKQTRQTIPSAEIVIGGHDATTCPEVYLRMGADYCALGEGESRLFELLCRDDVNELPRGILARSSRTITRWKETLDSVSLPGFELTTAHPGLEVPDGPVPRGVAPPFAVFETSRGCNEGCSFCDSTFVVGKFRAFKIERLAQQVLTLRESGINSLIFADDNLLYRLLPKYDGAEGRRNLLSLFTYLRQLGFSWSFYNGLQLSLLQANGKIDLELISALYGNSIVEGRLVGCYRAYLPLEKFWPAEMAHYHKLLPIEEEQRVVSAIATQGVPHLNVGFIIGNPRETKLSLAFSGEQARAFGDIIAKSSAGRSVARFYPFCSVPIPGTPDYKTFSENIVYLDQEYPSLYSNYFSVYRSAHFEPEEITAKRKELDSLLNGKDVVYHKNRIGSGE